MSMRKDEVDWIEKRFQSIEEKLNELITEVNNQRPMVKSRSKFLSDVDIDNQISLKEARKQHEMKYVTGVKLP